MGAACTHVALATTKIANWWANTWKTLISIYKYNHIEALVGFVNGHATNRMSRHGHLNCRSQNQRPRVHRAQSDMKLNICHQIIISRRLVMYNSPTSQVKYRPTCSCCKAPTYFRFTSVCIFLRQDIFSTPIIGIYKCVHGSTRCSGYVNHAWNHGFYFVFQSPNSCFLLTNTWHYMT